MYAQCTCNHLFVFLLLVSFQSDLWPPQSENLVYLIVCLCGNCLPSLCGPSPDSQAVPSWLPVYLPLVHPLYVTRTADPLIATWRLPFWNPGAEAHGCRGAHALLSCWPTGQPTQRQSPNTQPLGNFLASRAEMFQGPPETQSSWQVLWLCVRNPF